MTDTPKRLFHRKCFLEHLVFVDGFGRSGKFMASPIVASLNRVEHLQMSWLLEYLPVMHQLGKISMDAAIALLQAEVENNLYDTLIGRNANFRLSDITGIWNAKDPKIYFQRIQTEDGDGVLNILASAPPILLYLTHDVLCHGDLFFDAFEKRLKIIHIERHPVDVVASWIKKRTLQMVESLRNQTLAIHHDGETLPWYASGWEDEYLHLSQVDRLIHAFVRIRAMRDAYLYGLPDNRKGQVLMVRFEDFITDPCPVVDQISAFLGTTVSAHTPGILARERCPRVVDPNEHLDKLKAIRTQASDEAVELLMQVSDDYEARKTNG